LTDKSQPGTPLLFRLLSQQKYPPSALFLAMTLGPTIALVPVAESAKGWLPRALAIFGRVPLFYYLLHIPLIHVTALLVNWLRTGAVHQDWYVRAPFTGVAPTDRWSLSLLYAVFVIDVAILFPLATWYEKVRARHREKWFSYL
jgi:hypothetical protein